LLAKIARLTKALFASFQESEVRDGPVNQDMMRLYRLLSDRKVFLPVLKAKEGKVIKLLDANFGILEAGK
jgi:hypothetical protein